MDEELLKPYYGTDRFSLSNKTGSATLLMRQLYTAAHGPFIYQLNRQIAAARQI